MAQKIDFGNLAARLIGEFRRLSLAVKEYRLPGAGRPAVVTVEGRREAA